MADIQEKMESLKLHCHVSSLLETAVQSVVMNLNQCGEGEIEMLPAPLKNKCLYLMSKRGVITDNNILKVLHDQVRDIDLSDCDVSDVGVSKLSRCKNLQKINLNAAKIPRTKITSIGITSIARNCHYLHTVYLLRCTEINDEAVISLAHNCPMLAHLNVGGCHLMTDSSLKALGQHSHNLECINFAKTNVTDQGVFSLATGVGSQKLQQMHMDGCQQLTDEAVEAVLHFCPNISILLFHGCPKITSQSREALEEASAQRERPMKQVTWTIY